jgi:hypothetical protein
MKFKFVYTLAAPLLLFGCVHESAMPLGNHMAQIDVSAAPIYGRAGAQRIAMENAARTTLKMGYDKFVVVNTTGWNESTIQGGSYGSFNGNANNISGSGGGGFSSVRHPESKLVIRMFHNGEKGARSAVDAQSILDQAKEDQGF